MKNILFLLCFLPCTLAAQTPCFTDFRNKGLDYMDRKDYGEAISQFVAALVTCKDVPTENDLSKRIEESKRKWANDLQASVTEAQSAYRDALAAQKIAETAKLAEGEARIKAEENAQKAFKRGVRAESFRLALLADMARQQGRKTDALLLSWMGLQLSDTVQPYLMHAFGEAVRDTFSASFFTNPDEITSAQYLSGGQHVLLQTSKLTYFLVHLAAPVKVTQLPATLLHVALSPKDNRFIAWGNDADALIFNAEGKQEASLNGHTESIRAALFSPDGQMVLTCSRDNSARLWDSQGKLIAVLEGHTGNVQFGDFSPDGARIITRSSDGSAKVWDTKGLLLNSFRDSASFVSKAFISSSNAVFVQFSSGDIKVWDKMGREVNSTPTAPMYLRFLISASNGEFVAARSTDKKVVIFDAAGKQKATLLHSANVAGCVFTDDNQHLITWANDHVARLWDTNGTLLMEYKGHRKSILSADYHAGKKLLLTTSADGTAKLWDQGGNSQMEWQLGAKNPTPALFSPVGQQVLTIIDSGKSAALSPFPQDIYEKTDRAAVLESDPLRKAKRQYDIQFLETLGMKK